VSGTGPVALENGRPQREFLAMQPTATVRNEERGGPGRVPRFGTLPDFITLSRLVLTPVLWILALLGERPLLGVLVAVAGFTDILDGFLARRLGRTSRWGSQLDSVADMVLVGSITIWLVMLRPDFFRDHGALLLTWAALALVTLLVGWFRFHRFADLHLYSAKAAGFVGYLFVIYLLMLDGPPAPFFYVAIAFAFAGTGETLLVMLTRSNVDERVGSILRPPRRSS
jgi:phosphatidylglycerophosphate synthase